MKVRCKHGQKSLLSIYDSTVASKTCRRQS
jgi:hypothetical protein